MDRSSSSAFPASVVIIGGCGHAGLPLGIACAKEGHRTLLYDVNDAAAKLVQEGMLPFTEDGAAGPLREMTRSGALTASTDPRVVSEAEHVIIVLGTPVDEHMNPDPREIPRAIGLCAEYLRDGQLMILRSTVYPGVTATVEKLMQAADLDIDVTFCPERIAEGRALRELYELPQIIGARTEQARARAERFFSAFTTDMIHLQPEEAELAKLFTNTWRYIRFATANQLYMIANDFGLDFERIRRALTHNYPRAADMPGAGFAAGPCLLKDTMQLAAFNNNNFTLGHAAMLVNEGLPLYIVSRIEDRFDLSNMTVGILGMSFKAGSDDTRSSLSYKLRRILQFKARETLATDPYVTTDPSLLPLDEVVERCNLLVVATPHDPYASLETRKPVVDVWGITGSGVVI